MKAFFLTVMLFHALWAAAQPSNDDCANAISVNVAPLGTNCASVTAATTANATPSVPGPSCSAITADDDIWYSFTATSASAIVRVTGATEIPSGFGNVSMEIYNGTCGSLSGVFCENSFATVNGLRIVNGLVPGNTYYIRFWSGSTANDMNFNFCIQAVSAPPSNDECSNAIAIPTQPFGVSCAASVGANTTGATHSTPDPSCGINDSNDDIWYSFTANSSSVILRYSNAVQTTNGSGATIGYALYASACPVSTATVSCNNGFGFVNAFQIINGLTVGNTYYLRLFSQGINNYASFDFCVQDVAAAPVNDECAAAISITTQPFGNNCTAPVSVNTTGATHSTPDPSCGVADSNDDVWYSFTANSSSVILRYSNAVQTTNGSGATIGYALYASACPASTATVSCNNGFGFVNAYQIINGLTIGNTYYLRLFSQGSNNYASFDFCVQNVPAPQANDECTAAIAISTQAFGNSCTASVLATTTGATHSTPDPPCGVADSNDDIWYSFTASSPTVLLRYSNAVDAITGNNATIGYALYAGACPSTTAAVSCSNGFGFANAYQIINGLVPGTTYYLRLFEQGTNNYVSFEFCVQDVPLPPANNECTDAIGITTQPFGVSCAASVSANTTGATHSTPDPSCGVADSNDDTWYSFTANSESVILRYSNAVQTISGSGASIGYALYASACPASTATVSCNNSFGFVSGHQIISGLTIGNTYFLRLYSQGVNNYASFDFCVQDAPAPPVNDNCTNAIPVVLTLPGTNCSASVVANTSGATLSTPNPSCTNTSLEHNDDIWYSFTASASTAILRYADAVETTSSNVSALGYALYANSCPASTATLQCDGSFGAGSGMVILSGLTTGNTYLLRLFSPGVNNYISFRFCIQQPLPNDECINAVTIPVTNGFCNAPVMGSLNGATTSAGFGTQPCGGSLNTKDVWFRTTIPATGNLIIQTSAVKPLANNLIMSAYSGNCGSLSLITCDDDGNPEPAPSAGHSRITLTGRTPGEMITLRVTPFTINSEEQFAICAWDESLSVLPAIAPAGNCTPAPLRLIDSTQGNMYMWTPVFDNSGNIIAELYSDGNNIGTVTPELYVHTGAVRQTSGQFYLDRNIALQVSSPPVSVVKVRWYIKNSELLALQSADPSVTGINSLDAIKTSTTCQPAYGGSGNDVATASGNYNGDYYLQGQVSSFSSFYFDKNTTTLPVQVERFEGYAVANTNRISWKLGDAGDAQELWLERSEDGINFISIYTTNGQIADQYVFTDLLTELKDYHYRLRISQRSGRMLYSPVRLIRRNADEYQNVVLWPNPVIGNELTLLVTGKRTASLYAKLFTASGQLVMQQQLTATGTVNQFSLHTGQLNSGVYYLEVHTTENTERKTIKLIKQ